MWDIKKVCAGEPSLVVFKAYRLPENHGGGGGGGGV